MVSLYKCVLMSTLFSLSTFFCLQKAKTNMYVYAKVHNYKHKQQFDRSDFHKQKINNNGSQSLQMSF